MMIITYRPLVALVLAGSITACGSESKSPEIPPVAEAESTSATGEHVKSGEWTTTEDIDVPVDQIDDNQAASDVLGIDDIPYPLYPNGSRYRIGGENGLKIILFQTEDSFEDVDAYYQSQANMPRLSAMNDYVRYSAGKGDNDPWATGNPGIVIHQFNSESERNAVGADEKARTNIIMSFE